jgi:glycosyltransferase involved in cell wall biosynthesis
MKIIKQENFKMKLIYLTNIQIPTKASAQAIQTMSMNRVFGEILKEKFLLISPKNKENTNLKLNFNWKKISNNRKLPRALRQLILILKSIPVVLKFKPDNIYTRDILVACLMNFLGFNPVYEIHKPFETRIGEYIFKKISKKIKIVSISHSLKEFIIEKYNLKSENILVAHDGVFLEEFESIKETKENLKEKYLKLKKEDFVILYQGSFQKGKGMELILKVAPKIKNIFFVLIGGSEEQIKELEKNKEKNILFLGRKEQKQIPFYIKSADVVILPNTKELSYWKYTSPLKMFDYMASNVPILASNIGSIKEVLNEKNSFLFNPENINDLIEKIQYILSNSIESEKKVKIAFGNVKDYTWQKRAENKKEKIIY